MSGLSLPCRSLLYPDFFSPQFICRVSDRIGSVDLVRVLGALQILSEPVVFID